MSVISKQKADKIKENILSYLYEVNPKSLFTVEVAREILRDEEFTKRLLLELKEASLVKEISKSSKGKELLIRRRWQLSDSAFAAFKRLS
ncbi:MAG TPA: hypothetical protein VJB94_03385 [Candidatus Nanoarchaeia archaeon]|nr:hypothetical protein [Candidatus Nanoarchaeia archaeon]